MKKTKMKKKLVDTHPTIYAILLVIGSMLAVIAASYIIQVLISLAVIASFGPIAKDGLPAKMLGLLAYILVFAIYCIKHRKDFKGFFHIKGLGSGLLLGWSEIAITLFILIGGIVGHKAFGNIGLGILLGLKPGISEEILYRIIPISLIMKHEKREQLIIPTIITTSVIFGLIHSLNIFVGADPMATLFQVLYATGIGFLFAAIYMRTGNIWITMALHSFTDIVYYVGAQAQVGTGALTGGIGTADAFVYLGFAALYFINAFYIFRKSKREEIPQVWSEICTQEN